MRPEPSVPKFIQTSTIGPRVVKADRQFMAKTAIRSVADTGDHDHALIANIRNG